MKKADVRQLGKSTLKWLSKHPEIKGKKEAQILQLLLRHRCWIDAQTVALTYSMNFEYNTHPVFLAGLAEGKTMLMPKVSSNRNLLFYKVEENTRFQTSAFGIKEPSEGQVISFEMIDLLIVPGIIFNLSGYRIGFGGGFYDRLLKEYSGKSCSLVFSEQINDDWQKEPFDLPVQQLFIC